jgi:hypothetical protein
MKFCGEITYERDGGVHSDICWKCDPKASGKPITDDYRQFLHDCLDEWLDQSNGTGAFWLGQPTYFDDWNEVILDHPDTKRR